MAHFTEAQAQSSKLESARKEFIYRNALDDRESWYWEGIEYGEKK